MVLNQESLTSGRECWGFTGNIGWPVQLDMAVLQNKESNIPGRVLLKLWGALWGSRTREEDARLGSGHFKSETLTGKLAQ